MLDETSRITLKTSISKVNECYRLLTTTTSRYTAQGANDMRNVGDEIIDLAVAVLGSVMAAIFAAVLGIIGAMFFGVLLFRLGLYTREGAAWSGVGLGLPIGMIFATTALIYTFRKIRRYGEPR